MTHRAIRALLLVIGLAAPAGAQDYHGKFTSGVYSADGQQSADVNVRYALGDWTAWAGWYGPHADTRQARTGLEYDLKRPGLVFTPSVQLASRGFAGLSLYSEVGRKAYVIAGLSRTNLAPYMNLTFDPNESWQLGGGIHLGKSDSVAGFTIWDNRLHTGQQNTHVILRHYWPGAKRLTADVSYKSGRDDSGVRLTGLGTAGEFDDRRWFVKVAHDPHANFSEPGMWRLGGGFRF